MFYPDIVSLRQFYSSPLGEMARTQIAEAILDMWPSAKGDVLLGIGYCPPYLGNYLGEALPVMAAMPAQQGAVYWPPSSPNLVILSHESELPLPDNSVNRILLLHSVEHSEQLSWMMDEIWRVLAPEGRVLAVVPNRHGLWARSSQSPFGHGRPFSLSQLRDLLTSHQFTLTRHGCALFMPPLRLRLLWRFARQMEWIGKYLWPFFGGVVLVEAQKQLFAAIHQPVAVPRRYRVPLPAIKPVMGMK